MVPPIEVGSAKKQGFWIGIDEVADGGIQTPKYGGCHVESLHIDKSAPKCALSAKQIEKCFGSG